jgi:hypothetical protein
MTLVIIVFAAAVLCELALQFVPGVWRARKIVASAALIGSCFAAAGFVMWWPDVWSILLFVVSLFRALNMTRVVEARMHERYLRAATRRTSVVLIVWQAALGLLWLWWTKAKPLSATWLTALAALQLLVSIAFFASTARRLRRTVWPAHVGHFSNEELPSISVVIPARNETEDLQACLESIIASDYPKLEILVLDDSSQTKRTPEIIRSFAHDGVRFIQGDEPSETWLPKNAAYDRLANEASGEIIVFCGVDVRFTPDALRKIVAFMRGSHKQMVSILPERARGARAQFALAQGARYWWELAPPRRLFKRPAVLSTCWAIESSALKKAGGFAAVARSIVPEAYFAKRLIVEDQYSFRRADGNLGLLSSKPTAEQRATAIRTRYPQLHRRPENVLLASLFEFCLLLLPFGFAIGGFFAHSLHGAPQILAVMASVLLLITYELVAIATHVNNALLAIIALPFVILLDLALLFYSMWRYEFATVEWKGRNVTVPAMHVIPHLPSLPDA